MDKFRVTSHIKDDDLRIKMYQVVDICNQVMKNYDVRQTDFYNPFEVKNTVAIVNSEPDILCVADGGYDGAERAAVSIFPYYQENEISGAKISFLQIEGNFKFSSVSHRDYLGSMLGLGIKREKIGDILVHDDYCQVIVDAEIADYIILNLNRVGNNRVNVREIQRMELKKGIQNFEEKAYTVSSLRIDNIVAAAFNLSRQKAVKFIEAGFVTVNYEKIERSSYPVEEGAVISVRKKGKFILSEVGSLTRKDKVKIKIKKFV